MVETSRSSTNHSLQAGAPRLSKHRLTIRSHGIRTPRRTLGNHTGQYPKGREAEKSVSKRNPARSYPSHAPVLGEKLPRHLSPGAGAASLLERNVPPDSAELCREPRRPARARGGHWRRGSQEEAEAEKKCRRKGRPREAAPARGCGRGWVGWGGAGCASVGRSVSQSVHTARAPASPAFGARPRRRPGLATPPLPPPAGLAPSPGSSLGPPARPARLGVGPQVSASPGARRLATRVRSLPLPPLALWLWLPLAPVPFMKRGPITC